MFLVQNIYFPYNTIKYFEYGQDLAEGSLAEWSKALVLGTSPKGRGFESHRCQIFYWNLLKGSWRHRGSNPGHLACEASALPLSYIPYSWL